MYVYVHVYKGDIIKQVINYNTRWSMFYRKEHRAYLNHKGGGPNAVWEGKCRFSRRSINDEYEFAKWDWRVMGLVYFTQKWMPQ